MDLIFKRHKYIFFQNFSLLIGKNEFSFLRNGSDDSSKYQRVHLTFNEFHDKIIVANNFT